MKAHQMVTEEDVRGVLQRIQDPDLGKDIVALGFVKNIQIKEGNVSFTIELTTPACPVRDQMKEEAKQAVQSISGVESVEVHMTAQVRATRSSGKNQLLPQVKNVVPIASGKGGVGKSTVSANVALALSKLGARVGLMDADVYGPSIPMLMGSKDQVMAQGERIIPPVSHGIKLISMGFFLKQGDAVIWRGPMLAKMIDQFLGSVHWGELDYLIVDLPPGTGDVQLNLCQRIPLTGAAIVSTPQDLAFHVAEKAISMFRKLNTPVLGLIENMSGFECSHCGHREEIFGSGGASQYARKHDIPFLGEIPLSTDIRVSSDQGIPIVISQPDSVSAHAFFRAAENIAAQVSIQNIGGVSDRPEPLEITHPSESKIRIRWKDNHESVYTGYELRTACRCASCVNEFTGEKKLQDGSVPKDVHALSIDPMGRYALHFNWSDGHSTGIYTYELLRKLCPCSECRGKKTA